MFNIIYINTGFLIKLIDSIIYICYLLAFTNIDTLLIECITHAFISLIY